MAIPGSGALSLSAIQTEYGGSNPISLSEYYRGGSLVPTASSTTGIASSGAITMSSFYGTSNRIQITLTISSNINNYNIFSNKSGAYVAGISDITLVNNALIASPTTTAAALDTGSGWTSGDTITIDNNSSITGAGGPGGAGGGGTGAAGGAAGHGIQIQFATTIDNAGTISGGGGGGGGGTGTQTTSGKPGNQQINLHGGGGGGGGQGGLGSGQNGGLGGAGGTPSGGSSNFNGNAGAAGSLNAAGAGGAAITNGNAGGAGGAVGAAGTQGGGSGGAGGAAGKAINLNGNTVTFTATGTRNGATS